MPANNNAKIFNIVILGVGGQGLMTMLRVLSEAAFNEGLDVKTSELHGLSQRGGSVSVYIRFGEKVISPVVPKAEADLIIALEQQEAPNGIYFAKKETVFLINQYETPTLGESLTKEQVEEEIKKYSAGVYFLPASEICQKELGNEVVSGIFILGYAISHGFLPIKAESIVGVIKKAMPEKHWDINIKALELAARQN